MMRKTVSAAVEIEEETPFYVILSRQAKNLLDYDVVLRFSTKFILERGEGFRMTNELDGG